MNPIPAKVLREISDDEYYKVCCHRKRPGHICRGVLNFEHTEGRRKVSGNKKSYAELFVSVCSDMNTNPSAADRAWSRLELIKKQGLEYLEENFPRKDWRALLRVSQSFY